jgi:hypothetical protein
MVMLSISSCSANSEVQRYRGSYTWGHEVNSFCPQINSQCYWLSPITSQVIRERLKQLSIARQSKPVWCKYSNELYDIVIKQYYG